MKNILKKILLSIILAVFSLTSSCITSQSSQLNSEVQQNIVPKISNDLFSTILKKEIENSEVLILLMDKEKFTKGFFEKSNYYIPKEIYENVVGMYVFEGRVEGFPDNFIFIANKLNTKTALIVLYHEKGHYSCRINKCDCIIYSNNLLSEIHAYKNSLKEAINSESEEFVVENLLAIMGTAFYGSNSDHHTKAALNIINSPIWNECLKFLSDRDTKMIY